MLLNAQCLVQLWHIVGAQYINCGMKQQCLVVVRTQLMAVIADAEPLTGRGALHK